MARHIRLEPVDEAQSMALGNRRPKCGVLHHSDRSNQHAGFAYQRKPQETGMPHSFSPHPRDAVGSITPRYPIVAAITR